MHYILIYIEGIFLSIRGIDWLICDMITTCSRVQTNFELKIGLEEQVGGSFSKYQHLQMFMNDADV